MSQTTRQDVHTRLVALTDAEPTHLRSHGAAGELDGPPEAVGQCPRQLADDRADRSIGRWGRSTNTTRCVEVVDS